MATDGHNALGFVETRGLVAAIEAADAMVKTADVELLGIETTVAAMITVQVAGDTSAVQAAVEAGVQAASRIGEVVGSLVIPRPSRDLIEQQFPSQLDHPPAESTSASGSSKEIPDGLLENMTVRALRKLARNVSGLSIQGREIARANKEQLLAALAGRRG